MKDKRIEKWLSTRKVEWEYFDKIALADIDIPTSLTNQARINEPIKEEQVLIYMVDLPKSEFPSIALRRHDGKKYTVLDGNHRIVGTQRLEWSEYPYGAYIVNCSDLDAYILIRTANLNSGLPISEDERVVHAGQMVLTTGMTLKEAAQLFSVAQARIGLYVADREITKRMHESGIDDGDNLSPTTKVHVNKIQSNSLFALAMKAVIAIKPTAEEANIFAHKIIASKSEDSARTFIAEEVKKHKSLSPNLSSEKAKALPIFRKIVKAANSVTGITPKDIKLLSGEMAIQAKEKLRNTAVWASELAKVK